MSRLRSLFTRLPVFLLAVIASGCQAQTLARPGWNGSAISAEPWWRSAVFYRIAPESFQDSDGDGVGDLRGIAARLDYLQALGVDAVVLRSPFDENGFDDLLAEASRRHVRLIVELETEPDGNAPPAAGQIQSAQARQWLARGAGGILLPAAAGSPVAAEELRKAVRRIAAAFPGERVVIAAAGPAPGNPAQEGLTLRAGKGTAPPDTSQLTLRTLQNVQAGEAAESALSGSSPAASRVAAALRQPDSHDAAPLLELQPAPDGGPPAGADRNEAIAAALLLTQRAAVLLEYGQELGQAAPGRMPWTPTNVTSAPESPAEPITQPEGLLSQKPVAAEAPKEVVYGPYRPYVPPPPQPKAAPLPASADSTLHELAQPDPALMAKLAGFSSQASTGSASDQSAAVPSAALQERDPRSLLNLYRRLSALHHGDATLRSGSLVVVHSDADAVVWLRQAPPTARTAAPVLVAVNCGERGVTLSLESDFQQLGLRAEVFRTLLPGSAAPGVVDTEHFTLPPHSVFVGELVHSH